MSSMLSLAESRFSEPPVVDLHPTDLDRLPTKGPSGRKRVSRAINRFLVAFCIGVAATVSWQSYGDVARDTIASSYPQLGWLASHAAPGAQVVPTTAGVPLTSPDSQELKAISLGLDTMRERVEQLAAGQEHMTREITKLQSAPGAQAAATVAPPLTSPDSQELKAISLGLTAVRQRVDQLAASQEQVTREITRLQSRLIRP